MKKSALRIKVKDAREYLRKMKFFAGRLNLKQIIPQLREIKKHGRGYLWIIFDYLSMLNKGFLTFTEYYKYEFEKQDRVFRDTFLGSVNSNKYYRLLNPSHSKIVAKNKFVAHSILGTVGIPKANLLLYYDPKTQNNNSTIASDHKGAIQILKEKEVTDFVAKPAFGLLGRDISYFNKLEYKTDDIELHSVTGEFMLLSELLMEQHLVFESYVKQSEQFHAFNPSSVNCLRFMTSLKPAGTVDIIGITIKVGMSHSFVDNASQGGNINAAVDLTSGTIHKVFHFEGFRKSTPITHHPDTNALLDGVVVKDWARIKNEIIGFHKSIPYLKVIGWDIAITDTGPKVIELNCEAAITPQLFIGKGWKKEIKDCYRAWQKHDLLQGEQS